MEYFTVLYLVVHFLFVAVIAKIVGAFYGKRRTSFKVMCLSILPVYLTLIFIYILMPTIHPGWTSMLEIPTFLVGCFVITLNYESTTTRRLAAALYTSLVIMFLVIFVGIIYHFALPDLNPQAGIALTNITLAPIGYLISKLIRHFKSIRKKAAFSRPALIAPLTSVMTMVVFFITGVAAAFEADINIIEIIGIIMFIILLAWLIYSNFFLFGMLSAKYEDKLKSEKQAQEKEYYFAQCQLMQESAEQVKTVRHDIKLHLATLKDFTTNGNMDEIKSYLDSLVEDIEKSEIYSDTGNIAFDSIINYKLQNAKRDNIKLDLNVAVPPELNVEVVDIVTIIGNLLDNALEAVAKVSEKIIKIDIKFNKGGLFAKIENSFNGEVKYDENKAEGSIVSLKNSNEHGYGLKNIKQSVEKYNGHMKISHTENIFSTGVLLYVYD